MKAMGCVLSLALICSLATLSPAETLRVAGIEMPPWSMKEGELGAGINIDVFREAAKRAGYDTTYKVLPYKRKIEEFRNKQIDIDPGTNPNWRPDDQEISVYSIPFYESVNVVFVRKDSVLMKTFQDFKGKRLGCLLGYNYTNGFQEALDSGDIVRDDANNNISNIKKLCAGRVDGIIIDRETVCYLIRQLGLNGDNFHIAYMFETRSVLYIRIHKHKEHILPALNAALEEMKKDGTILKIIKKYTQ